VSNYIDNIMAELVPVYGNTPDTHDVLTQYGSAVVSTKAPDLQNPAGVIKSGTATAGENLALSGNYGMYTDRDSVSALFSNLADVSIGGITASTAPDRSDYPRSPDTPGRFSAEIEPENGARIVDANLGSSATVGFEKINAIGAIPTLSGGVQNWASFSGAYNPNGGNVNDIEASVANEQGFTLKF
jgi:hypothetical protein